MAEVNESAARPGAAMRAAIGAQAAAFASVFDKNETTGAELAHRIARARRVRLVGIGTSYAAASLGASILLAVRPDLDVRAEHAFDFVEFGPAVRAEDLIIVFSHRGTKRYALAALARAKASGCPSALVRGVLQVRRSEEPDCVLETTDQDPSSAHTVSLVGALAAIARVAAALAPKAGGYAPAELAKLFAVVPEVETSLAAEAQRFARSRMIWFTGAGPGALLAAEAALKVQETSYKIAAGLSIEALLHGPFQGADPNDLFVAIANEGPAIERVLELIEPVIAIGGRALVLGSRNIPSRDGITHFPLARAEGPWAALAALPALQLFAYHLALACGTNADSFRLDDPRFARARVPL
jgi:glucosamine--fructose-6-phosphate aminotransferase (isomerizing)